MRVSHFEDRPPRSGHHGAAARTRSWHLGWPLAALGTAGSVLMALSAPHLTDTSAVHWWYVVNFTQGHAANMAVFYLGLLALSGAWLGIGRRLRREPETRTAELWVLGALWSLPLLVGPALCSADMYSYLAQGTILHLGLNPYHVPPAALGHLGRAQVLGTVSPFWRHTTAPYGPLFLGLVSVIAGATGRHLVAGVLLVRALEVAGVALLAVFVPRLARSFGSDACRATWLGVISPLVLVELIAAGHNDALMAGLMVAGVALARERHPLVGIALCTLAATVKVPAGLAVLFILVSEVRGLPTRGAKARFAAEAIAITAVVAGAVSAATGLGLGWISKATLSTPSKVHLAITPSTALGWTVARALHLAGVAVSATRLESGISDVALALTAVLALVLAWRARPDNFVLYLGVVLLTAAFTGPAAWPWYFSWGLVLVAGFSFVQKSRWLPIAPAACVFLVKPDGILALPLRAAPECLACYVAIAAYAAYRWRRRPQTAAAAGASGV